MLQSGIRDSCYNIGAIWARNQLIYEEIIVCVSSVQKNASRGIIREVF
jgi:hypothetical protein